MHFISLFLSFLGVLRIHCMTLSIMWLKDNVSFFNHFHTYIYCFTDLLNDAFFFRSTQQPVFNVMNYTIREPIGVVGVIAPWNLPLYLLTWKIAPCIATGRILSARCQVDVRARAECCCRACINEFGFYFNSKQANKLL